MHDTTETHTIEHTLDSSTLRPVTLGFEYLYAYSIHARWQTQQQQLKRRLSQQQSR